MRRCRVSVAGIEFALRYRDFLYELWSAIESNAGLHVRNIRWDTGNAYIATLRDGTELPVMISADRRVS